MEIRQRNRTGPRGRGCTPAVLFSLLAVAGSAAGASGGVGPEPAAEEPGEDRLLPRSLYVPVEFEVASCLRNVVIRNDEGRVRAVAPGNLVSQFTWYEGRAGLTPEWERLTVEGEIVPGPRPESPDAPGAERTGQFRAALVITPTSIYFGRRRLDLEPAWGRDLGRDREPGSGAQGPRLRRRADTRIPRTKLLIRPAGDCGGPHPSVEATARRP